MDPSQLLPGGTEVNHEQCNNSRYPDRDSYRAPPEYKSAALPLNLWTPNPPHATLAVHSFTTIEQ
jgi:hypothetical protein